MEFKQQATDLLNGGVIAQKSFFEKNQDDFLQEMVKHIGAEDGQVRDELNFRLLIDLLQYEVLTAPQKEVLLQGILQNKLLLHKLGECDTPSVFTRALSAEWLRLLVTEDQIQSDLGEQILQDALLLLDREVDLRAQTATGFAYSVGNSALLINILLRSRTDVKRYAPSVLTAIQSNFWKTHVFTDDEEERLISLIEVLLVNDVDEAIIIEWIEQVFDRVENTIESEGYSTRFLKARTEILHFMKSLYFVLKFKNDYKKIQSILSIFIQKWNRL
ncbi:MAG: DUF2785 domain-containing protein [Kurthia sp.]|nr:DUF2785 domain-containing protein [Candidatus Kurthia equi]